MREVAFDKARDAGPLPTIDLPKPDTMTPTEFPKGWVAVGGKKQQVTYRRSPFKTALYMVGVLMILFSATMLASLHLYLNGVSWWESAHLGVFQGISIISGTGLVTAGSPIHESWPAFVPLLLLLGSFFGGCVGSTCGGIKAIRFLLLYLMTAFGAKVACLNDMGVGLGEAATGCGVLNDTVTWLMSLAMLVGRLEVFPLLLFLPDFWK